MTSRPFYCPSYVLLSFPRGFWNKLGINQWRHGRSIVPLMFYCPSRVFVKYIMISFEHTCFGRLPRYFGAYLTDCPCQVFIVLLAFIQSESVIWCSHVNGKVVRIRMKKDDWTKEVQVDWWKKKDATFSFIISFPIPSLYKYTIFFKVIKGFTGHV